MLLLQSMSIIATNTRTTHRILLLLLCYTVQSLHIHSLYSSDTATIAISIDATQCKPCKSTPQQLALAAHQLLLELSSTASWIIINCYVLELSSMCFLNYHQLLLELSSMHMLLLSYFLQNLFTLIVHTLSQALPSVLANPAWLWDSLFPRKELWKMRV